MFDDEDEEYNDSSLNEDLEHFEEHLKGNSLRFIDSDRLEGIIDHYLIQGQYNKAKIAAEFGIYQFAYNPLFRLRKAQALGGIGLLQEALDLVQQLERQELFSAELFLTRASIHAQQREHKLAIKYFEKALEYSDAAEHDYIYLDIAIEYERLQQYQDAIDVLHRALKTNKNNEAALYELGRCYDALGATQASIDAYLKFIDEQPYSSTAWYNLGNAYSKIEDFDRAVWAYDYAILINEEFGPAHFNLGNAYLSLEKYHKAIEHFDLCMKHDGDDAMALCYIGEAYEQLNELDLSKHYYKKSIALEPMLPEAWLGLGIVEDLLGSTKEGIVLIQKALDYDPENAGIYHVLAGAYEKIEATEEANYHYLKSLELGPTDEEALNDYMAFLSSSSLSTAQHFILEFLDKHPRHFQAQLHLINLKWQMGQVHEAKFMYLNCLNQSSAQAKNIFEINPKLLDDSDFLHLTDDL
ncbi:MAG: tetratricopeptide repeat protein [Crocinitomicaceae bacterium]